MLDLDPCGGTDPLRTFPLFLKRKADVLAPSFSVVFQRLLRLGILMSVRLGRFMEGNGVLPTTQFACRKGLGTRVALLCVSHTLQSAL